MAPIRFIAALFALFAVAVAKWIFDHFLYDWLLEFLRQHGIEEGRLIAASSGFIVPLLLIGGSFVAVYRLGLHEGKATTAAPPPQHRNALSLPTLSITEIAEYLRDESAWGYRALDKLNFRRFVQDIVPDELRRAARQGQVRFIGSGPLDLNAQEINRGYWDEADFDDDYIWDPQSEFFTSSGKSTFRQFYMRYGRAPKEDVLMTWPAASLALRLYFILRYWIKFTRHRFPKALRDERPALRQRHHI